MPPTSLLPIYRRVFLALTCLLFVFVCAAVRYPALYAAWNVPLAGDAHPYFADSAVVAGGAGAVRANGGRFTWDDLSARGEPYNYPRVWAYAGWIGLDRTRATGLGLALAALLLVCEYRLLRPRDGWTLLAGSLVLFSPGCLLLLERGNNDIPVLALILAATAWLTSENTVRRGAGSSLLLLAACLKLYPVAAFAAIPRRGGRRVAVWTGALLAVFAGYVFVTRDDLAHIAAMTPRPYHGAYGGLVLTSFVGHSQELHALLARRGMDLSSPARLDALVATVRRLSLAVMLLLGGGAMLAGIRSAATPGDLVSTELDRVRFRAGAAIYGGTFVIGNNWDYRLAFLTLTVPLLGGWLGSGDRATRRQAAGGLGLMVLCLWAYAAPRAPWAFALIQGATWGLFAGMAFLFGTLLPANVRDPARRLLRCPA